MPGQVDNRDRFCLVSASPLLFQHHLQIASVIMSRRSAVSDSRVEQNRATLKNLVKLESNKTCSDCKRNKRLSLPSVAAHC